MNTRTTLSLAALVGMGLIAAPHAYADTSITLQNGNFSGNFQSNNVGNFIGSQTYGYAYGNHYASAGNGLYVNGGSVYQLLGITGDAGENLTLNGFYENYNGKIPATSTVEFTTAAPTSSNDLASGSVLTSEVLTPPSTSGRVAIAPLTFTTTMANQSIYLVIGGPDRALYGDYGGQSNYSAFSLKDTPAPPSAAPEPSQFAALAFTGLGILGMVVKTRKRKTVEA